MAARVARIIRMGKLGGYAALLNGVFLEVEGRMLWPSASALIMDARRIGVETSTHVIDTHSVSEASAPVEQSWTERRWAA